MPAYVADYDDREGSRPVVFQLEGEPPVAAAGNWFAPYDADEDDTPPT